MKKNRKKADDQDIDLVFMGETLDTNEKIIAELNLFLPWYTNHLHETPDVTIDEAVKLFAHTRPWGAPFKSSLVADMRALLFVFYSIFDTPEDSPYKAEIDSTDFGKRLKVYEECEQRRQHDPNRREVSLDQFIKATKLQAQWDNAYGAEWEQISKRQFDFKQITDFLDRAEPDFKRLKEAFGVKLCKAKRCLNLVPIGRTDREYCSEGCRRTDKSRRWRENNPDKKIEATKRYGAKKIHEKDGITETEYELLKRVKRSQESKKNRA